MVVLWRDDDEAVGTLGLFGELLSLRARFGIVCGRDSVVTYIDKLGFQAAFLGFLEHEASRFLRLATGAGGAKDYRFADTLA